MPTPAPRISSRPGRPPNASPFQFRAWSALRDQATAKPFAGVRQRLDEIAKAIRGKATTADTFAARRSVPRETLRYAPLAVLSEDQIHALADRFDESARQGPAA
jgi:hypothetical protein